MMVLIAKQSFMKYWVKTIYLWPFSLRIRPTQMLSCIIMTTPWHTKAVETQWSIWLKNYKQKAFGLTL
ncbi:hypothetical protein SDC9_192813 [bioreactor metagenome]|uniref:Uncharacterized protein n=1 Tax=bioreactor metagenome TaxID=1076179 RepID=A0A645I302_9ZZZZ